MVYSPFFDCIVLVLLVLAAFPTLETVVSAELKPTLQTSATASHVLRAATVQWNQAVLRSFGKVGGRKYSNRRFNRKGSSREVIWGIRGGDQVDDTSLTGNHIRSEDDDPERYSRQVYTLGARAHALIRSAVVYIDGPLQSGLAYECAKNLALSGIRHIYVVTTTDDADRQTTERHYHNAELDDLGLAYKRGSQSEIFGNSGGEQKISDKELFVEYLRRLSPTSVVATIDRSVLLETETCSADEHGNVVYLCVDRPFSSIVPLNTLARQRGWAFVAVETAGVFGRVMCDLGDKFTVYDADGEAPALTPLHRVEQLVDGTDDDSIMVYSLDGERHDVSRGDLIQFQFRNGESSDEVFIVGDVQTPQRFTARAADSLTTTDDFISKVNEHAVSFSRMKVPREVAFQPLESVIKLVESDASFFTPSDLEKSLDETRQRSSLAFFQALSMFVQNELRLPALSDITVFWELVKNESFMEDEYADGGKDLCLSFLRGCAAKFVPLQAAFGAIGAQEALKAATGLYFPVKQILLHDCDEVLGMQDKNDGEEKPSDLHMNAGLRYILGNKIVNSLESKKIFVVGAGAIGCEILKNLAAMNVGTRKKGVISLTDMDTIEKSNLSRQLLFRDGDVGKFKSTTAQAAALRMNAAMKIESHSSKVGANPSPFDDSFWTRKVDVVLNALDNMDARLYIDYQCVTHKKALVDAGTLGSKCNVQVVVPHKSESYASSVDPPEPSIPVCTLKNFPYAISHTIQWGKDLFNGLFQRRPEQVNDALDKLESMDIEEILSSFDRANSEDSSNTLKSELREDLSALSTYESDNEANVKQALQWAAELSLKVFYKAALDMLSEHPPGSVDEDSEPFWSGTRRQPRLLVLDPAKSDDDQAIVNANFVNFIRYGARLRLETVLGEKFSSENYHITGSEAELAGRAVFQSLDVHLGRDTCESSEFSPSQALPDDRSRRFIPIDFEKDDDTNGHVAFITAASNLRALIYGIPPVDALETRRVAGNIIPAMITTTAIVSALSCIELVKLVQKVDLPLHRNAFINLALPFFAFTAPLPPETMPGLDGKEYTLWDQMSVAEGQKAATSGGITIKSLLKHIQKKASDDPSRVSVASISCGPFMLYANFLHEDDVEVLESSLWDILALAVESSNEFEEENSRGGDAASGDPAIHKDFVDLLVVVEDLETGDEVELPPLRVHRYKT